MACAGKACERELVPCASHPCERGGVCHPTSDYTSYTCSCPSGWQGASGPPNAHTLPPRRGEGHHTPGRGSRHAVSQIVYLLALYLMARVISLLQRVNIKYIKVLSGQHTLVAKRKENDVLAVKKEGVYGGGGGDGASGWSTDAVSLHPPGYRCSEDVDECRASPCRNRGRCLNNQGSYACDCQPGFSVHNCQSNIDDCSPSESRHART